MENRRRGLGKPLLSTGKGKEREGTLLKTKKNKECTHKSIQSGYFRSLILWAAAPKAKEFINHLYKKKEKKEASHNSWWSCDEH